MKLLSPRTAYSRAEYLSDTIVHVSGLVIVLICVPILFRYPITRNSHDALRKEIAASHDPKAGQ